MNSEMDSAVVAPTVHPDGGTQPEPSELPLKDDVEQLRRMQVPPRTPAEAVAWMNVRYFVVFDGGKALVFCDEPDLDEGRDVLTSYTPNEIRQFYQNRYVHTRTIKDEPKTKALGSYWLSHPDRRTYRRLVFSPKNEVPGCFNLWRGFKVTAAPGDWSLMNAHIRVNICQEDDEVYSYVRKWMAFAVQNPDKLPQTALVMRGKQGTGKGVFARGFGELFGQHFLHLSRAKNLVGNFNAHLRDAVVVFADEAFLAGDKDTEGVLKALITEPDLQIEQKFKDLVKAKNRIHLIAASNNERVISAAPEERRFCVLDVGEKHMQDHAYFAAIKRQMDQGGSAAMLHELLAEDLRDFNIFRIPKTGALRDQKLRSLSDVQLWWFKKLQDGCLVGSGWSPEVPKDELVTDCMGATRMQWNAQKLRFELGKLLPPEFPAEGSRSVVAGGRKRSWRLPPLEACRVAFDKFLGSPSEWPEVV